MKCAICAHVLSSGARYCGSCGTRVEQSAPSSVTTPTSTADLAERLTSLAQNLRKSGAPPYVASALESLASSRGASGHVSIVIGEKGRGKTTVVNRMLGVDALPIGRHGYQTTISLRIGREWQIVESEGDAKNTTLPIPAGLNIQTVLGTSEILQYTTLLDAPPFNDIDQDFEERILIDLVRADTFLICVAANRFLSQSERDLIRLRLLPLLGGNGVLVVTHTDFLESDEDRKDIRTRAERFAGNRLRTVFMPEDLKARPLDLIDLIHEFSTRQSEVNISIWKKKVAAFLRGIIQELTIEAESETPTPAKPTRDERLASLVRLIESEHSLALVEAESTLRQRLSSLRMGLSGRVAYWTLDYSQNEGRAEVAAEVQAMLRETCQLYVSSLEQSLSSGVPRTIQIAAENTGKLAPEPSKTILSSQPETPETAQVRDLRIPLLGAAGFGLLFVSSPIAPFAAIGALFAYRGLKKQQDEYFKNQVRSDTAEALSNWIASTEQDLVEQFRNAVRPVVETLLARVKTLVDAVPEHRKSPERKDMLDQARECLALAEISERAN